PASKPLRFAHDLTVPPVIYLIEPEENPQGNQPGLEDTPVDPPQFLAPAPTFLRSTPHLPAVVTETPSAVLHSQAPSIFRTAPQALLVPPVVAAPATQPPSVTSIPVVVTPAVQPTPLPAQVMVPAVQPPPILRSCAPVVPPPVQVQEKDSNTEQNLALRSGRFFHRRYPQTQQSQVDPAEPTEDEEEPVSMYDLLKQLDQTPAKITILDLIRRSRSHQEEMYKFLQRVMVDESLPPERIIGAILTFHNGPLITFSDEELA